MTKRTWVWVFSGLILALGAAGCEPSNTGTDGDAEQDVDSNDGDGAVCVEKDLSCDGAWTRSCQGGVWVRVTDCAKDGRLCEAGLCHEPGTDGDADEQETEREAEPDADTDAADSDGAGERETDLAEEDSEQDLTPDGDSDEALEGDDAPVENETPIDGDAESEAENDRETEADTEVEAEAEADGDVEREAEADGDVEREADSPAEAETENDSETEAEAEVEAERESEEAETEEPCVDGPCCAQGRWLSEGEPCLSGADAFACTADYCDAAHACSVHTLLPQKCLIDAVCYEDGEAASGRPCLGCDAAEPLVLSPKPVGLGCDDGDPCSYGETCDGLGACALGTPLDCPSATDICGARQACNGTSSCSVEYAKALTPCEADALACTDDLCDGAGLCEHRRRADSCLIDGVCYPNHASNPNNECQWCDAQANAWAAKDSAESCTDDGNPCTNDVCGGGACTHPPKEAGTGCDDGLFCNGADACDGKGACAHAGDPCVGNGVCDNACDETRRDCHVSPFTTCRAAAGECDLAALCDGAGVCPANALLENGFACGTADQCLDGRCVDCTDGAGCADMPEDGLPCTEAICDTTTHACAQNPAAHFAESCGDAASDACDEADSCDANGICQANHAVATVPCEDGNPCTLNDRCNGLGACAAGAPQTCNNHGSCNGAGTCDCQPTFGGESCESCAENYWDYPACKPKVLDISTSANFSCALLSTGAVKCWGRNDYGQLGNGTTATTMVPTTVIGLGEGVVQVSTGGYHACALMNSGAVMCWGWNYRGLLGAGEMMNSYSTPIAVNGLSGPVLSIRSGGYHTCALMVTGGVQCWGDNEYGQLGNGAYLYTMTPKDVTGLSSGVAQLSSGTRHTCAVMSGTGAVKCWGKNDKGQVGDLSTVNRQAPVDVIGLDGAATMVAAGFDSTCAVVSGSVRCWGANTYGGLGDGTTVDRLLPVTVVGLTQVATIGVGSQGACALLSGGGVKCWGHNSAGQLGNGLFSDSFVPVDVLRMQSGVTRITTKPSPHSCAVLDRGGAKCWGNNVLGELGNGNAVTTAIPVDVVW